LNEKDKRSSGKQDARLSHNSPHPRQSTHRKPSPPWSPPSLRVGLGELRGCKNDKKRAPRKEEDRVSTFTTTNRKRG